MRYNFNNIDALKDYMIHLNDSENLIDIKEQILDDEYESCKVTSLLSELINDKTICQAIKDNYRNSSDMENMKNILFAIGLDKAMVNSLMRKMRLPITDTDDDTAEKKEYSMRPTHLITINYDSAWKDKIFKHHFASVDNTELTIEKIIELAGKIYQDKMVLDIVVGYYSDTRYFDESVWGITEEILRIYNDIPALKDSSRKTLSKQIGDAIIDAFNEPELTINTQI